MNTFIPSLTVLAASMLLIGCQSPSTIPEGPQSTIDQGETAMSSGIDGVYNGGDGYQPGAARGYNAASNGDFYDNATYGKNTVGGPSAPAKDRVIYFSYDSSRIDSRSEGIVKAHAQYLRSHSGKRILLEGHTDRRGTKEYNIALGERRAISVLKRFKDLGVPISQIRIISYGEENPAVPGYTEEQFKRNRRVVIQY